MIRLSIPFLALALAFTPACSSKSSPSTGGPAPVRAPGKVKTSVGTVPELEADPREGPLSESVTLLLMSEHLRSQPVNDEISKKAFASYIEAIDFGKLYLLEEDVEQLRAYEMQMDDQIKEGNLLLARIGGAMVAERRKHVSKVVADILKKPFDFTKDETFEQDAEKRAFARTEEELADRWRRLLKLTAMQRVEAMGEQHEALSKALVENPKESEEHQNALKALEKIPAKAEEREEKARSDLAKSWAGRFSRWEKVPALEPAETFINAIVASYDPHTLYLVPDEKDNFDIEMSGTLEGIGAVLAEDDHYIVVREIVPGGASWRDGRLEAGDLILAVAQKGEEPVDTLDMPINDVVRMIRGPKGTVVKLTVKKPDDRVEIYEITRDVIEIDASFARGAVVQPRGKGKLPKMGYVYLPSFYGQMTNAPAERTAAGDVKRLLAELKKKGVKGVVLDLRSNGGGLLDEARDITGLFIETGPVVQTRYASGKSQVLQDADPSVGFDGEVVVLVDRLSASASEILAGALQDYGRAIVVGTGPTHGKGTVQMLVDLSRVASASDRLGVLKLTIQQYFRIDGESTQWRGVEPDVLLPDPLAHVETGERFLDNSIPWSEVEALPFKAVPGTIDIASLRAKSEQRQAADERFRKISERANFLKKRQDRTLVQLKRDVWQAEQKKFRDELEKVDPKIAEGDERISVTVVGSKKTSDEAEQARISEWKKEISRDPWLEESLYVLSDLISSR